MGQRQAAELEIGEQRLDVAHRRVAGGGVAHMADRGMAGQAADHRLAAEIVADMAERAVAVKDVAVPGDDAGGFLAAMLKRVQAQRGEGRGIGMAGDAEHAALVVEMIVVVPRQRLRHGHNPQFLPVAFSIRRSIPLVSRFGCFLSPLLSGDFGCGD